MVGISLLRCSTFLPCNDSFLYPKQKNSSCCKRKFLPVRQALQEDNDAKYIVKLISGCAAGAAVIKYGSLLVPGVTNPNLATAITMVTLPVALSAVLLLVASSRTLD